MQALRNTENSIGILDAAFRDLATMMEEHAHDNMAPLPIAISLSDSGWTVDIHVRLADLEYELQGDAGTLAKAIRNATTGFTNDHFVQDQSYDTPFGVRKVDRLAETRPQS